VIIVIFGNFISQGSVATQLKCGGIFSNTLLQIYKFSIKCVGENNFENRSIPGEDMHKSLQLT